MKGLPGELTKLIGLVTLGALLELAFVCSVPAQEIARVRGVVTDPSGARVSSASVSLESEGFKRTIQCDQIGRFEFDVPPGKYKLSVASGGFDNFAGDVVLNSGANEELAISLFPTPRRGSHAVLGEPIEARVRGLIADQSGALVVSGTLITLESKTFKRTIRSDQLGRFEVDVPAGKYKLSVGSYGFDHFARDVVLNSGDNEELEINLFPAPRPLHWSHTAVVEPEVTIEVVHAPVFQRMAPIKLR